MQIFWPQIPHPLRPWGSEVNFLEHGRVALHIKGKHKCKNVVANIFPADPNPLTLG